MLRPLRQSSIGRRLMLGFALTLGLALVGSGFGAWSLDQIAGKTRRMTEESMLSERLAADTLRNVAAGIRRTAAIAVSSDATLADFFAEDIRETTQSTSDLLKRLEPMMTSPEEQRIFANMLVVRKGYIAAREKIAELKKTGDPVKAREILDQTFTPAGKAFQASLQQLTDMQRREVDEQAAEVARANRNALLALLAFSVGALLLGGALATWLTRGITRPIRQAVDAADRIARLDLTQRIGVHDRDETGQLLQSLQSMQTALRGLVDRIRQSTDSIGTASAEIADGNLDLSTRTEHAASSLQETAAAMLQMSASVQQSSHTVRSASDLAIAATDVATKGGEVVSQVVATMEDINASSQKIADIIGVIDGIAFQTNILALNAAVEAARAGTQGRGFAVVASEVRLLAQRSAEAAKEIKGLIGASVDKVEAGTRLVAGAGSTMTEVVASSRRVSALIQEISQSAAHQSEGIGQVNATVTQLDQVTQQNAALVEEAAAAAASLKAQAAELNGMVQRFVV